MGEGPDQRQHFTQIFSINLTNSPISAHLPPKLLIPRMLDLVAEMHPQVSEIQGRELKRS